MTYITAEGKHTIYSSEESLAQAFIRYTNLELNDIKHSFIKIGFRLAEANENRYYKELGYENIVELAEKEFDLKSSVTYNLMQIWRFAHDKQCPMEIDKRFDKYRQSQLLEMSRSKHVYSNYRLAELIPETATKEEIRKIISEWNRWESVSNLSNEEILKVLQLPLLEVKAEEIENNIFHPGGKTETVLQNKADVPAHGLSTDEVISECLRRSGYKHKIYQRYLAQPSKEEFIEFLKDLHGNQGESWSCGDYFFRDYSPSKGITLMGRNCANLIISWSMVASRIRKLIEAKQYLTEDELHLNPDKPAPCIADWESEVQKREQDEQTEEDIEFYENVTATIQTPDDELVEYCLTADCHSAVSGIKFQIYERYLLMVPTPFFRDFIINCYGNFTVPDSFGCGSHFKRLTSNKLLGLIIDRLVSGQLALNWNTVTGKIINLIKADKYLTADEKEKFEQSKASSAKREEALQRKQTRREYLATLPVGEFVTELLLEVSRVYPLGKNSAALISNMRQRITEWLNAPYEE